VICDDNFKSATGSTCANYVSNSFCTPDGRYGSGWSHGLFSDWKDPLTGLDASACTACGCGRNGKSENKEEYVTVPGASKLRFPLYVTIFGKFSKIVN